MRLIERPFVKWILFLAGTLSMFAAYQQYVWHVEDERFIRIQDEWQRQDSEWLTKDEAWNTEIIERLKTIEEGCKNA